VSCEVCKEGSVYRELRYLKAKSWKFGVSHIVLEETRPRDASYTEHSDSADHLIHHRGLTLESGHLQGLLVRLSMFSGVKADRK
jgi:hypothetical protein